MSFLPIKRCGHHKDYDTILESGSTGGGWSGGRAGLAVRPSWPRSSPAFQEELARHRAWKLHNALTETCTVRTFSNVLSNQRGGKYTAPLQVMGIFLLRRKTWASGKQKTTWTSTLRTVSSVPPSTSRSTAPSSTCEVGGRFSLGTALRNDCALSWDTFTRGNPENVTNSRNVKKTSFSQGETLS